MIAVRIAAVLEDLALTDVDSDRGIIFEGVTAGGSLGITVNDTHLETELIDKDHDAVGLGD